jgi:pimeloyl-ACP methyl ester carboxylesterase
MRARVNGVELAYDTRGTGPRVVWAHGLASSRDGDRDIIEALAERFEVLAWDARGHGSSSPVRDPSAYSYPHMADDAIAILDQLDWRDVIIAGTSMGAGVLGRAAALRPDLVAGLAIVRPAAMGPDGRAPDWLRFLFAGGAAAMRDGGLDGAIAFLRSIPIAREALEADPERLDVLREEWGQHDPLSIAAALEGMPASTPLEGGVDGSSIRCPVVIVPGADLIHPAESAIATAAMIPNARLLPEFGPIARAAEVEAIVSVVEDLASEVAV